ncbi:hypothetical protein BCR35DRAFT_139640 [Leucosporidium creatinivorum]|uniref:Uncharacterized protein n=1 Tax=Leucosporidium creatinivorum TaxID=106004 RepID=A0A1Y2ESJ2_9BASI|nr:hypothetical protein BCR35DRAFT_139640 [Leucosporidium creatinivorum]
MFYPLLSRCRCFCRSMHSRRFLLAKIYRLHSHTGFTAPSSRKAFGISDNLSSFAPSSPRLGYAQSELPVGDSWRGCDPEDLDRTSIAFAGPLSSLSLLLMSSVRRPRPHKPTTARRSTYMASLALLDSTPYRLPARRLLRRPSSRRSSPASPPTRCSNFKQHPGLQPNSCNVPRDQVDASRSPSFADRPPLGLHPFPSSFLSAPRAYSLLAALY